MFSRIYFPSFFYLLLPHFCTEITLLLHTKHAGIIVGNYKGSIYVQKEGNNKNE